MFDILKRNHQLRVTSEDYSGAEYDQGSGTIWLDDIPASDLNQKLKSVGHNTWGSNSCNYGDDVSINCLPNVKNEMW